MIVDRLNLKKFCQCAKIFKNNDEVKFSKETKFGINNFQNNFDQIKHLTTTI